MPSWWNVSDPFYTPLQFFKFTHDLAVLAMLVCKQTKLNCIITSVQLSLRVMGKSHCQEWTSLSQFILQVHIVTQINTLVAKTRLSVVLNKTGNINLDSPLYLTGQIKTVRHLARNQFQRELEQTLVIIKPYTKKYSCNTGFYLRY